MKKLICFVIPFLSLFVSAFAVEWPPANYDMPRTVLTPESAANSIRAMGNTGLLILGVVISVSLTGTIFRWLLSLKPPRNSDRIRERQIRKRQDAGVSELREIKLNRSNDRRY